jgi:plastocyanin
MHRARRGASGAIGGMVMRRRTCILAALAGLAAACGSSYHSPSGAAAPAPQGPGFFITISGYTFSPLDLRVPPGATVTVLNDDGMPHSVTSEARPSAFTPGSVSGISFDTGQFTGTKTFAVASTATAGTVIPYYCTVHTSTMVTPNGTITIDPSASATTASPGSGGGGGGMPGY